MLLKSSKGDGEGEEGEEDEEGSSGGGFFKPSTRGLYEVRGAPSGDGANTLGDNAERSH